jgi:organic radical activating enzyme
MPRITLDDIMGKLDGLAPGDYVSLNGGEPGLVPRTIMDPLMEHLIAHECDINVNTNGEFFRRYPDYIDIVHTIQYHCSEKLDLDTDIEFITDTDKVSYVLVIDDDSLSRLGDFMDKYSDITFKIYAATRPYSVLPNRTSLSKANALKLVREYGDRIDKTALLKILHTSQVCCDC